MLTVLLVPIVKDKTGKISNIENYRPIALASLLSTTHNQFGFKPKHSTDMYIHFKRNI